MNKPSELDLAQLKHEMRAMYGHIGLEGSLQAMYEMLIGANILAEVITEENVRKVEKWPWPFQRMSDGPEYSCPHGVGHSSGVHGCDGCCTDPNFPRETK